MTVEIDTGQSGCTHRHEERSERPTTGDKQGERINYASLYIKERFAEASISPTLSSRYGMTLEPSYP
jgi:hypothetical protein